MIDKYENELFVITFRCVMRNLDLMEEILQ